MIPPTLRPELLNIIHQGQLRQEKCLCEYVHLSSGLELQKKSSTKLTSVIPARNIREKQKKSQYYSQNRNTEHGKLSSDLFEFKGQQYLLLTDQYSRFPVIRRLTSNTSSAVINNLKSIFAEHGIPMQLMTDNRPQYSSTESKHFMNVDVSPMYPQSNGFAERIVQTVENILQKCDENKEDPYPALLSY